VVGTGIENEFIITTGPYPITPDHSRLGGENDFHRRPVARAGGENGPLYNPPPSSFYPSSPFHPTIFAAISYHVVQDFSPLLKYWYQLLGLSLVTSDPFNSSLVSLARF